MHIQTGRQKYRRNREALQEKKEKEEKEKEEEEEEEEEEEDLTLESMEGFRLCR